LQNKSPTKELGEQANNIVHLTFLKKSHFVLFLFFELLLIKVILKYKDILNMKIRELCNMFFILNEVSSMFLYE
jgi:membrane protein CcdC involved in cytochrome C biogenesis